MRNYIGLIHKDPGSDYGVSSPDFPGVATAGKTLDEARAMGEETLALRRYGGPGEQGRRSVDNCGWFKKLYFVIIPMIRPTIVGLYVLDIVGKMMVF